MSPTELWLGYILIALLVLIACLYWGIYWIESIFLANYAAYVYLGIVIYSDVLVIKTEGEYLQFHVLFWVGSLITIFLSTLLLSTLLC